MNSVHRSSCVALSVTVLAVYFATSTDVFAGDQADDVQPLVRQALQSEVDGDPTRRNALLSDALQLDPQHVVARWHAGYVQVDDNWLTVQQAEQRTIDDGLVPSYRNWRNQHSGNLGGELWLARWCRKNGLEERERLHWGNVLRFDPSNKEARGRLGLREFRGQLLTAEQIEEWKQGMREYQNALDDWNPLLSRWQREIESSSLPHLTEAWRQLSEIDAPRAVPALEKLFYKSKPQLQRKIVLVLRGIDDQVATDALVRFALGSQSPEIRDAAATGLADRNWFGFVPSLLARLETPVEFRYQTTSFNDGVITEFGYSQENANAVMNVSQSLSAHVPMSEDARRRNPIGRSSIFEPFVHASQLQQRSIAREASRHYKRLFDSLKAVQAKNAQTSLMNERIFATLQTSTGQLYPSQPQYWWDWWKDYNELDDSEEKPRIDLRYRRYYSNPITYRTLSCFLAGTPVWTETGAVPIEDVRRGDRVLSQDPRSGELGYKMVLDTTIREPSPTVRIQVADEPIFATLGHPMWVVGRGWRMAKELGAGDQFHGVDGGVTIDEIEPGPLAKAYNLVVADTNTYFVGKCRVLVHDNMAREAIDLPVPGWEEVVAVLSHDASANVVPGG